MDRNIGDCNEAPVVTICMVVIGALCVLPASAANYSLYCPYGTTVNSTQGYSTTFNGDFKAGQKWYFDLSVSAPTTIFTILLVLLFPLTLRMYTIIIV